MLQGVVTRLAGNSAQCKTWCVAIVSALFALAGATKSGRIADAAIIPIVVFGFVDAAYLANERAYCELYNRVVTKIRTRSYDLADYGDLTAPLDFTREVQGLAPSSGHGDETDRGRWLRHR